MQNRFKYLSNAHANYLDGGGHGDNAVLKRLVQRSEIIPGVQLDPQQMMTNNYKRWEEKNFSLLMLWPFS